MTSPSVTSATCDRTQPRMTLSSRRRRRVYYISESSSYPSKRTIDHAAGQSYLELLPLELLTRVFIESQNANVVGVSKTLYANLGGQPTEWLMLKFFGYQWEGASSLFMPLMTRQRRSRVSFSSAGIARVHLVNIPEMD